MGITAVHAERGRVDASLPDLGCGWPWVRVHRVRPRVPLSCPECGHAVHAKVSSAGLRYFAHDPGSPACALAGESMEHHLTKLQLATAIRAAGWVAELEVRGPDGAWRADVMATSPDGRRRMAWEAQLSAITAGELAERTARFARDGVRVCWVAVRRRPWLGAVPSLHAAPTASGGTGAGTEAGPAGPGGGATEPWRVVAGLARFEAQPCECDVHHPAGHGSWHPVTADLDEAVGWVLGGRLVPHRTRGSAARRLLADEQWWDVVWTAPQYVADAGAYERAEQAERAEAEQAERERHRRWVAGLDARARERAVRQWQTGLPMQRRWKLEDAAAQWVREATGCEPSLDHGAYQDELWAGGLPVLVNGVPYALIRPHPEIADWDRLAHLVIITGGPREHKQTVRLAPPGTRVISLPAPTG
ncbi:competence protein CoiA family protein [Kitasatospora cinereorecta]|uniref:Competence protein CoiA family protein n=1 Tax=Kitasatospora cinereorecta TaxID=285560 RepID=A0ABW0VTD6_9ACTN